MKKIFLLLTGIILLMGFTFSRDERKIPSVIITDLKGKKVNTSTFKNEGKPIIINFWATWCKSCKTQLDVIAEHYSDWQKETGVKLIAISIDSPQDSPKVAPEVEAKEWPYEFYLDEKEDFKKAMNTLKLPRTFLVNGNGEIVWSLESYTEGDEEILYENIKKIARGEKLSKNFPLGDELDLKAE